MPQILSLQCFDKDFSQSSTIDIALLKHAVAKNEQLRLEKEEERLTLLIKKDGNNDWWPLLWVEPGHAYINLRGILNLGLYYDLVNVAEAVNACIVSEDVSLLFIPGYGLLYDPDEKEDEEIEIGELHAEMVKTGNLALSIKNVISTRKEERYRNQQQRSDKSKLTGRLEAKQRYIAIAIIVILTLAFLITKKLS